MLNACLQLLISQGPTFSKFTQTYVLFMDLKVKNYNIITVTYSRITTDTYYIRSRFSFNCPYIFSGVNPGYPPSPRTSWDCCRKFLQTEWPSVTQPAASKHWRSSEGQFYTHTRKH